MAFTSMLSAKSTAGPDQSLIGRDTELFTKTSTLPAAAITCRSNCSTDGSLAWSYCKTVTSTPAWRKTSAWA